MSLDTAEKQFESLFAEDEIAFEFCRASQELAKKFGSECAPEIGVNKKGEMVIIDCAFRLSGCGVCISYYRGGSMMLPPNTVEFYFTVTPHENAVRYTLYDLAAYFGKSDFFCPFYQFIENKQRMNSVISGLESEILLQEELLSPVSASSSLQTELFNSLAHRVKKILGKDIFSDSLDAEEKSAYIRSYHMWMRYRLSELYFSNILRGRSDKALRKLHKSEDLSVYEKLLEKQLTDGGGLDVDSFSRDNSLTAVKRTNNLSDFMLLLVPWLVTILPLTVVYAALFLLAFFFLGSGTVADTGLMNLPSCMLPALITAIPVSVLFRDRFTFLFPKKDRKKVMETDSVMNRSTKRFCRVLAVILTVASVSFTLLMSNFGAFFRDTGFTYKTSLFPVVAQTYDYSQIDSVWYCEGRYAADGYKKFPSYVLLTVNHEKLDFYQICDETFFEEKILPLLRKKGFDDIYKASNIDSVG